MYSIYPEIYWFVGVIITCIMAFAAYLVWAINVIEECEGDEND